MADAMKKIIKILLLFFAVSLLLTHTSIAPHEPDHLEGLEEQELATYDTFLKKPTLEGFEQLSETQKTAYISSVNAFTGENEKIAATYFLQTDHINTQKNTFEKYVLTKGISLTLQGNILHLDTDFVLQTKSSQGETEINLVDWKDVYHFQVESDGSLTLLSKKMQVKHTISGIVGKVDTENGREIYLTEGTIDGKDIVEGIVSLEGEKIVGFANAFNGFVFREEETGKGNEVQFAYDLQDNTFTILNQDEEKENLYFVKPGKDMTLVSTSDKTIYFAETADMFRQAAVTYDKEGAVEKITAMANDAISFVQGLVFRIALQGETVALCQTSLCVNDHINNGKNYVSLSDKALQAGGNNFQVILSAFHMLDLKEKFQAETGIKPKKLLAESLLLGSNAKGRSDYYDHVAFSFINQETIPGKKLEPWNGGTILLEKRGGKYQTTVDGQAFIQNGYWEIYSDGNIIGKGTSFNPQQKDAQGNRRISNGRDVMPMELSFLMQDGSIKDGFSFVDKKGAPDLFQGEQSYAAAQQKTGTSLTPEEFQNNFIAQLQLLKGQPLDFSEGTGNEEIKCTSEFVCVDVVSSAYYLTTGIDLLEDKSKMGFGSETTRRNSELYGYFKANDVLFETQEFDGKDFLGSDEKLRNTWNKGVVVDPTKVVFSPSGTFDVDWEGTYGLEKDKVQFMMFEKQYVKQKEDGKYVKTEGSPMYHIVPVFWDDTAKEYMTIQAPGECRTQGVCQIPLTKYTNNNRCSSLKDMKTGCYAYYGVTQVIKAKVP